MVGDFCATGYYLREFPIDLYCAAWFGFIGYVTDFNALNHCVQNFWCQFLNICVLTQYRVHLPTLHTPSERLDLLKQIRIQHFVVDAMSLRTLVWSVVMMSAEIDISVPIC